MPLAALIAAKDDADPGPTLRATLPLAGRTLIEYQADLVLGAGAEHVVLLVERVPASLAEATERLRRGGARIDIARGPIDAIDRFHPDERILLVADGATAAPCAVKVLASEPDHAVLTVPDLAEHEEFERIDAAQRWAGFALVDKAMLGSTAQMLGEWDLTSTVLRRLVQADARRIDALASGSARPVLARGPADLGPIEAALLRRAEASDRNWVERFVHRLAAAQLIRPLIARGLDRGHVAVAAAAMGWAAVLLALFGLFWAAVLLLPFAAILAATSRRMGRIWAGPGGSDRLLGWVQDLAGLAVLALLVRSLVEDGGWGWWIVAALLPASLVGLAALEPVTIALRAAAAPPWLASRDALIWSAPALSILAGWRAMLIGLAAYATVSFVQRCTAAWRVARKYDNAI